VAQQRRRFAPSRAQNHLAQGFACANKTRRWAPCGPRCQSSKKGAWHE
jgi:hypothetical protein